MKVLITLLILFLAYPAFAEDEIGDGIGFGDHLERLEAKAKSTAELLSTLIQFKISRERGGPGGGAREEELKILLAAKINPILRIIEENENPEELRKHYKETFIKPLGKELDRIAKEYKQHVAGDARRAAKTLKAGFFEGSEYRLERLFSDFLSKETMNRLYQHKLLPKGKSDEKPPMACHLKFH